MSNNIYINLLNQAEKIRKHNRQGSFKTKERYFEAYKRFLRYIAETFHLEKIANISGKHFSSYIEYMQNKELSPATIKTDLAAIRFWHDQIPQSKYTLPGNDEFELECRKFGGIDRTWSKREFNLMISECRKASRPDYEACINIARYAALRIHEVMRIDTAIAKAAIKNGYFTIRGKGGKIRQIPINDTIRTIIKNTLKTSISGHKLFVPDEKQTHIAITELQNFINTHRKFAQDKNRERPMTFHGLRHTCAAEWFVAFINQGKTEHEACLLVSKWLGHERAEITRIYLASIYENNQLNLQYKDGDCDV